MITDQPMRANTKRRVQQREIATRTGVSISTVSRVLNNVGGINDEVRRRVLAAAGELGYWEGLPRTQSTLHHLGLFVTALPTPSSLDPFHADLFYLKGIEAECRRQSIHLSYTVVEPGPGSSAFVLDKVKHNHIDAALFLAVEDQAFIEAIVATGLQAALINAEQPDLLVDTFLPDNTGGAALAVRHLLQQGHRRILYVTSLTRRTTRRRLEAYWATLEEAGLAPDPALVLELPIDLAGLAEATELMKARLTAGPLDFSAVFCRNDVTTIAMMRALQEVGLRIPHDISIVGYDDIPIAAFTHPPLTTVRVEREELGALAVRRLTARALDPQLTPVRFELATRLIVRQSVLPLVVKE